MFGSIIYAGPALFPVPYLDFIPGLDAPPWKEGRVFYDEINKTLAVYNNESDVTLQLGQELYLRVKNTTAEIILNGSLVYINGGSGIRPTAELAQADSSITTRVVAMATHDIGVGEEGFCTTFGSVGMLNTLALPAGTPLYLSDAVPGGWTGTAPSAPSFPIHIGIVTYQHETDGRIQVSVGPTDVAESMVIYDLEINHDLRVAERLTLKPSPVADITAAGGITVTHATMRIQGDGGPVVVTANPQIAPAGTDGQLVFLHGSSDINTVTVHDKDGLHLHSGSVLILGEHDHLMLQYDAAEGSWEEVSTNFKSFDTSWAFSSPAGFSGTYYVAGFYLHGSTSFTPAGGTTLGVVNASYAAHAFLVLGATSTDMVVRVTGTSITDAGVRTSADFEDIDTSGGSLNDYFETPKKWVGQVSYSLQSGTGVEINNGLCKYWDNQNSDFRITGLEVTGQAGSNDTAPNFLLHRHTPTGWTFNSGSEASPQAAIADMQSDHGPEYQFSNGQPFAWKRLGLSAEIAGNGNEGVILEIVTTSNKSVEIMNWTLSIRPS